MRSSTVLLVAALVAGPAVMLQAAGKPRTAPRQPAHRPAARTPAPAAARPTAQLTYARNVAPLVQKYCGNCHGERNQVAGITFHSFKNDTDVVKARKLWTRAVERMRDGDMPPRNAPQPTDAERKLVTGWVETRLAAVDCDLRDPGRVTMRRLNRAEYNNTVRDLLGVDLRPADDFPSDDVGHGFDNIGDVLSISPLLMEKYIAAADRLVRAAIVLPGGATARYEAERIPETGGDGTPTEFARNLYSNGQVFVDHNFPRDGTYRIRIGAFGQQAGNEPARMAVIVDGKQLALLDVPATEENPGTYEVRATVSAGKRRVAAAFTNDYYNPNDSNPRNRDRNLLIDYIEIAGPEGATPDNLPASHKRILIAHPGPNAGPAEREAATRKVLANFARRAYRRPVTAEEVNRLARIAALAMKEGEPYERGIQLAVQAALCSPNFLFRVEPDAQPNNPNYKRSLTDWELATRLSYFLWSSMPDDQLFSLAEKGQLRRPEVLAQQARRMLKDPRAYGLVENFGEQWLTLRNLQIANPNPAQFPAVNAALKADMLKETQLFFESVMREDRSIFDFLEGAYTFVNERLARHYGLPGVTGPEFRRVDLTATPRRGVLTQASILTLTSNPTRTSPVKRGKWVLEQLLGTPPPPALPGVPELKVDQGEKLTGTLRQMMEQHRKDPTCANCHARLDPLGFGLENFDAVGAWRTEEGGAPIDASGSMPDGASFNGPRELAAMLRARRAAQFRTNFGSQLMTFALGRGLEYFDRCAVDTLVQNAQKQGDRFSAYVLGVVNSEPFRIRRGEDTSH